MSEHPTAAPLLDRLARLRERVALYGGAVDAGPRPGGGWRLRATTPLPQQEFAGA